MQHLKMFGIRLPKLLFQCVFDLYFLVRIKCKRVQFQAINDSKISSIVQQFVLVMQSQMKIQGNSMQIAQKTVISKKEKIGRWSAAECYMFQCLLQRFGKNWKKIQEHMKNRSLGQIRSHAQKHFDKIGAKKVEEFERRAKLLEAYETLQKEKQLKDQAISQIVSNEQKVVLEIKQEEQSPVTTYNIEAENIPQKNLESSNIKEQQVKPSEIIKEDVAKNFITENSYPFLSNFNAFDGGYLLQIIGRNPGPFYQFKGIEPYIDCPAFRASMFQNL